MLIIRRRRGESIVIGEDIEIEILETSPTQVKLGISAPKDVPVLRSEIRVTRDANRAASSQTASPEKLSLLVEQLRDSAPSPNSPPAALPGDEKSNIP
ncbi:MAG TPA: carbon storage regulator [Bryobacteraceae bacterium]|nr:carbon storage regulator [Bryobacteraceae bacterium]